ncbi:MAG: hypothetical protein ACU0CA_09975 [Paracoccaceae bacterium]
MSRQGEPRVFFTLIGVLILGILDNGLTQIKVDSYIREILAALLYSRGGDCLILETSELSGELIEPLLFSFSIVGSSQSFLLTQ